jgi:hypothetical protein
MALDVTNNSGVAWQTAVGTGWAVALEVHKAGEDAVFATVSGDWEDVGDLLNPTALFPVGEATALFPATIGDVIEYECYIALSKAGAVSRYGADDDATPFSFTMKRVA